MLIEGYNHHDRAAYMAVDLHSVRQLRRVDENVKIELEILELEVLKRSRIGRRVYRIVHGAAGRYRARRCAHFGNHLL